MHCTRIPWSDAVMDIKQLGGRSGAQAAARLILHSACVRQCVCMCLRPRDSVLLIKVSVFQGVKVPLYVCMNVCLHLYLYLTYTGIMSDAHLDPTSQRYIFIHLN